MICPICNQTLGKSEGLLVQDDAFGDAVVWHVVSDSILNPIGGARIKSRCGQAGFRLPWTENGARKVPA